MTRGGAWRGRAHGARGWRRWWGHWTGGRGGRRCDAWQERQEQAHAHAREGLHEHLQRRRRHGRLNHNFDRVGTWDAVAVNMDGRRHDDATRDDVVTGSDKLAVGAEVPGHRGEQCLVGDRIVGSLQEHQSLESEGEKLSGWQGKPARVDYSVGSEARGIVEEIIKRHLEKQSDLNTENCARVPAPEELHARTMKTDDLVAWVAKDDVESRQDCRLVKPQEREVPSRDIEPQPHLASLVRLNRDGVRRKKLAGVKRLAG